MTVDEGQTEEYPAPAAGPALPEGIGDLPFEDEDDEWAVGGPAKAIRLALPTAALVAVLLAAGGFWGGAALEKRHGTSSSGGGAAAVIARLRGTATGTTTTGTTTTPGFGGGLSSATAGTVSVVSGNTLYVLTAEGALVKVTLGRSTTITRNAKTQAVGLRPGDTVVVQGSTGTNGAVSATSVAATAPGVSSGAGRFGGFGG